MSTEAVGILAVVLRTQVAVLPAGMASQVGIQAAGNQVVVGQASQVVPRTAQVEVVLQEASYPLHDLPAFLVQAQGAAYFCYPHLALVEVPQPTN